jgi:DNA polymerase-3 subunit alpha
VLLDIDVDLADRDFAIKYLTERYGTDKVCQILNFSYITPCVAIKDTGRVLGIPYAICDKISKKFVYDTFQECMENNKELVEQYAEYAELFRIAAMESGRVRNVSIHAGGVAIVDSKITDYMAMKLGAKGEHVIEVDKKKAEAIGLVKFDLLGVRTLVLIQEVMADLNLSEWDLNINNPKFANDKGMYELIQSSNTDGIFQIESQGMKDLIARLQPSTLDDVSAVLALYRPDSMAALDDYIERRTKGIKPTYIHPDMAPILDSTCGCLIYQEQLMDIVRKFGGRSYGGADLFRKAIG